MSKITYTELLNKTLELYLQGDYLVAYNYITDNAIEVKGNDAQIYNFRYSIASKAGLTDLAMDIVKEAVVKKGYWYSYDYLMGDDDLKPLYEYEDFKEIANICRIREKEAKKDSKSDLKVLTPKDLVSNNEFPLVIALHGNEESIVVTEDHWRSCVVNENILALPQSSQIHFSGGYYWNDTLKGTEELKEHYNKILKEYNIDTDNIIIGGFSAGARISLNAMLNDVIGVKGFIFVGPWLPEIEEWEPLIDILKEKEIKGYIICGDQDEDCLEDCRRFVKMLDDRNIPNVFKLVEGLKHEYPKNFDKELEEAIGYIRG